MKRRIQNAELLVTLYFVSVTAVLTMALGGMLRAANYVYSRSQNSAEIILRPESFSLYMAGGLVAFFVVFLTIEWVHRRVLGPPPESFSAEYTFAASPGPSWMNRTALTCLVIASLVAILNVRKHAIIGSSLIVDQLALSIGPDQYPLNGVRSIEMARFYVAPTKYSPPHISDKRALFVKFEDGRVWSPHSAELYAPDQSSLAELISSRSGEPVSYPREIEGVPDEAGVRRRGRIIINVFVGSIFLFAALWAIRRYINTRRRPESAARQKTGKKVAG